MTYTKDDVEIFLESTAIGNPIIQGKNYYLKLKSGNKIVSLSASMTNTPEWPNGQMVRMYFRPLTEYQKVHHRQV
ncbi:Uncharacterised protein [Serratia quinivorans]|nr:Uncharacterised protein [Serratia quinivorans]CAI1697040.1 Uncharacterised protein [Serratia quinivorans]